MRPKAVNVMLNFKCAEGCGTATFRIVQRDMVNGNTIVNTTITGNIASLYTYANKSRVTITPLCGGTSCSVPVIFDIQCNTSFCPSIISWPAPWIIGSAAMYNNSPLMNLKEIEAMLSPVATKSLVLVNASVSYNGAEYLLKTVYSGKERSVTEEITVPLVIDKNGFLKPGTTFNKVRNGGTGLSVTLPNTGSFNRFSGKKNNIGHAALLK